MINAEAIADRRHDEREPGSGGLEAARASYQAGAYGQAERLAREGIGCRPGELLGHTILAASLYKQGRVAEALESVEIVLKLHPEDEDILLLQHIFMQALAAERWVAQRLGTGRR